MLGFLWIHFWDLLASVSHSWSECDVGGKDVSTHEKGSFWYSSPKMASNGRQDRSWMLLSKYLYVTGTWKAFFYKMMRKEKHTTKCRKEVPCGFPDRFGKDDQSSFWQDETYWKVFPAPLPELAALRKKKKTEKFREEWKRQGKIAVKEKKQELSSDTE